MDRYYWLYKQSDSPMTAAGNPALIRGPVKRPLKALKESLAEYPGLRKEPEYLSRTEFRLGVVGVESKRTVDRSNS